METARNVAVGESTSKEVAPPRARTSTPTAASRGLWCKAHYRSRPCSSCEKASVRMKAKWADPKWRAKQCRAIRTSARAYALEEIEFVRTHAGMISTKDMARELKARGFSRSHKN